MSHEQSHAYSMVGKKADVSAAKSEAGETLRQQWQKCLEIIQEEVPPQSFQTWFMPILPVSLNNENLILRVPSRFFFEWLDSHYNELLNQAIATVFGEKVQTDFLITPTRNSEEHKPVTNGVRDERPEEEIADSGTNSARAAAVVAQETPKFDTRYCFEHYFPGQENELALKATQAIADGTSRAEFLPLVLHGGIGTGKTYLLHAIGNAVHERDPRLRVKLMSSEQFLHEYVAAVQGKEMKKFLSRLLNCDYFLFEDLQFLSGKMKSQDELYFVLSQLAKRGASIVITINHSPARLEQFHPRLVNFCQKGLVVDLHSAQFSTRERMVRHLLTKENIHLEEKVIQFLVKNLPGNLHQLNAVMVRIVAQISLLGRGLGMKEAEFILAQFAEQGVNDPVANHLREISIGDICRATAQYFEIPVDILQGLSRKQRIVRARQVAIYLCREITVDSLNSIGYHFSNLHHASVLYAHKKIKNEIEKKPALKTHIDKISSLLMK